MSARRDRILRCRRGGAGSTKAGVDLRERRVEHKHFVNVGDKGRFTTDFANKERIAGRRIAERLRGLSAILAADGGGGRDAVESQELAAAAIGRVR